MNVFNTLILKQIFWKVKTVFQKSGVPFLDENPKIESASFPYKTAKFKTNRMWSTKWTYYKQRSFVSDFIFSKILFQFRTSYEELIWCTNYLKVHIYIFHKDWSFISECFSHVSMFNLEPRITLRCFWDVVWVTVLLLKIRGNWYTLLG